MSKAGWLASSSNLPQRLLIQRLGVQPSYRMSGDELMATEYYVVRHHGTWRIRVNGKHHGDYQSRVSAINAATLEAQAADLGAKVFSTRHWSKVTPGDQDRTWSHRPS
jgi:hypothetical protein